MISGLLQSEYNFAHKPSVSGITPVYSPIIGYGVGSSTAIRPWVVQVRSWKFSSLHKDSSWFWEVYKPENSKIKILNYCV